MTPKDAREFMAAAFEADTDFRNAYVANIAMLLHDHFNKADFTDYDIRNDAGDRIVRLVFES